MIISKRRERQFGVKPVALAFACLGANAIAQTTPEEPKTPTLGEIKVQAQQEHASSPKFTAPLVDTPKSITVIDQKVMQERGVTSLADVLRTTPGISLASGEGGTPMGDRPFIRGFESANDLTIDGMRDLGRITHEAFNLEAVEIVKGPGSVYAGRGSTGGTINMVSKAPQATTFATGSFGLGNADYLRATVDGNWRLTETVAARLNFMVHDAGVPGRNVLAEDRVGVAPSVTFGMNGRTRATLSYYMLRAENTPDLGIPFDTNTPGARGEPLDVSRSNFYGISGRDRRRNDVDIGTVELSHDFGNGMRVRNITRNSKSINQYVMTRPTVEAGAPTVVTQNSRQANRLNQALANQTDLSGGFSFGQTDHNYSVGLELSKEELWSGATPGFGAATTTSITNPNPNVPYAGPTLDNFVDQWDSLGNRVDTKAVYGIVTSRWAPKWETNVGVRFDDYRSTDGTVTANNSFWNYQVALIYKPAENASVYLSTGTSSNPSGETAGQSGGADGASAGGLNGGRHLLDPERNRTIELGTKWNLFGNKLLASAAIFRTEKTNQRATDPVTNTVALIGNSRAEGLELGLSGDITPKWSMFGGYTYIDAKLVDDGAGTNDGKELKYIARNSASLWTTYKVTPAFTVGGGANFMSKRWMNDANTMHLPSYWRYDAMASYRVSKNLDFRLNVQNLSDETIYDGSHVGLFANVAPGRAAILTANISF